jgi:phosphonate transport system ATP-binding protein
MTPTTQQLKKSLNPLGSSFPKDSPYAIDLRNVVKTFEGNEILGELSLRIEPREAVSIAGPSGSGKSTLLKIIAGALLPDKGEVFLYDRMVNRMGPGHDLSRLVGMIPQQYDLVPNLSALQNVLAGHLGRWSFWTSLRSLLIPVAPLSAIAALDRVGIGDRPYRRASRLSGGEQQRVAVARVLVQDPSIMLADEPVSSLDPTRAEEIIQLLVNITKESHKTLVASVHSIELARSYFSRCIGLRNGKIMFDLPARKVTNRMLSNLYKLDGLRRET